MILTCPNCATRYEADEAKFLPAGRKVRCAKCSHIWHQSAPAEAGVEAPPDLSVEPEKPASVATAPMRPAEPAANVAMAGRAPASAGWRLGALAGWAALIALVVVLAWVAIVFRMGIATVWPQTATLYSWVGLDVNTVGLEFQDVSYRVTSEDDMSVLHIKGKVVNKTARSLDVPAISAALTDEYRRDLYAWKIQTGAKSLAPGKSAEFSARIPSPPSGTRHVDLKFVKS
ncbi:MAG TPA: DUF3426 domain-containing protein [Rhizomicrobium sp.]|nr:DUF3426 domain-containing protein [Rhizomicrobium sp.]